MLKLFKDDFYVDLFLPKYTSIIYSKNKLIHLENTLDLYCSFHKGMNETIIKNDLKKIFFEHLLEKDTLILLGNNEILFHTYRILSLLTRTQVVLETINSIDYPHKFFAKFCQDKREIKRKANFYKKFYIKAPSLSNSYEIEFKWKIFEWYYEEKELFQLVLNSFSLININQLAEVHKTDSKIRNLIEETFQFLSIQKTNMNDVIKSLGILLFYYLREILKFTIENAKFIANSIVEVYFDSSFNDEDIEKKVYIRSIVKGIPIFGAKRKQHYTPSQKTKIKKKLIDLYKNEYKKNRIKIYDLPKDIDFDKGFETLHLFYLTHSPLEFLFINPKYKNLDIKTNPLLTDHK